MAIYSGIEKQMKKLFCVLAIFTIFGVNADSSVNPAGIRTPHTWKDIEALGVAKKHNNDEGMVSTVEFDLTNIKNCLVRTLTVTYMDFSKKPSLALSVPIAEIRGKYKITAPTDAQKQIVMGLRCHNNAYSFVLIE